MQIVYLSLNDDHDDEKTMLSYTVLKMNKLLVAAIASEFSCGCHDACKIFLVKSMLSGLMSSFLDFERERLILGLGVLGARLVRNTDLSACNVIWSFFGDVRSNRWK